MDIGYVDTVIPATHPPTFTRLNTMSSMEVHKPNMTWEQEKYSFRISTSNFEYPFQYQKEKMSHFFIRILTWFNRKKYAIGYCQYAYLSSKNNNIFHIKCGKAYFNARDPSWLAHAVKYVPHVIRTIFFVRCIPIVDGIGVVLRAES